MLGVMVDGNGAPTQSEVQSWANRYNLDHPVLADQSRDLYNFARSYPTYMLIDRDMTVSDSDMYPVSEFQINQLL